MLIKYMTTPEGLVPYKGTNGSACWDIYLPKDVVIHARSVAVVPLGIIFDLDPGFYVSIYPRSSALAKHELVINESIIDSDYKGEVHLIAFNTGGIAVRFQRGDRLVQFMVHETKSYELDRVVYVPDSGRGGLGSTGD